MPPYNIHLLGCRLPHSAAHDWVAILLPLTRSCGAFPVARGQKSTPIVGRGARQAEARSTVQHTCIPWLNRFGHAPMAP